jgi:hypothetical protein
MNNHIFSGKGVKNNESIIKILYAKGCLTPWKIANELALLEPKKPNDIYHKAQNIQSLLVRKNGRLEYLVKNEFIRKTEDGYCLTVSKGVCSALVFYGDKQIPKSPMYEYFNMQNLPVEFRDFLTILQKQNPDAFKESYKEVQGIAIKLLSQGLNIEKLSNERFNRYFEDEYEQLNLQQLRSGEKSKANTEWTPELREAANRFIGRMVSLLRLQVVELQKSMEKYAQEQHANNS